MKSSNFYKIIVFVPVTHLEMLQKAIGDAGAGKQGNYSHCSFVSFGKGYFTPLAGASPAIGLVGKAEVVEEARLEFLCEREKLSEVIQIMLDAHPYEEVAYDIVERLDI